MRTSSRRPFRFRLPPHQQRILEAVKGGKTRLAEFFLAEGAGKYLTT